MNVYPSLDAMIVARRLRAAVERDLDQVVRACQPADWQQPAHEEPKLAFGCSHPMGNLVITMGGTSIVCRGCLHRLDREEVEYRLQSS
jgi:hypothetical protein